MAMFHLRLIATFLVAIHVFGIESMMTGGWSTISLDDVPKNVLQHARVLLEADYNARSNDMYFRTFVKFDPYRKAQQQVVAGMNYKFDAILAPTECTKNGGSVKNSLKNCKVTKGAGTRCTVTVNYQAWQPTNKYSLVNSQCNNEEILHMKKRSVPSEPDHTLYFDHEMILGHDGHDIGTPSQFASFIKEHKKEYTAEEYKKRFVIFSSNMKKALVLQQLDLGDAKYGASPFADMTEEEFRKFYLTPQWDQTKRPETKAKPVDPSSAPDSYDWRDHGAVTQVKNQGQCGSCWAFSTTGNIEGQWFLKKKQLVSLSEQELVDCDKVDQGCGGGLPSNAYKEIMRIGGLEMEKEYPYRGKNMKCSFEKKDIAATINGSVALPKDEAELAAWLAQHGPISIGINAAAMQFYMGGVSHPWRIFCSPSRLDHGVLIVGYGMKGSEPYWIVKNSWGPTWGEKGYYLVYRGGGVCGLNTMCTSAVIN